MGSTAALLMSAFGARLTATDQHIRENAELEARWGAEQAAQRTIDAYRRGEIPKSFDAVAFVRRVTQVLSPGDSARLTVITHDAIAQIERPKKKGPRGVPKRVREVAVDLAIVLNKKQHLPIGGDNPAAFDAVAGVAQRCGLYVTSASVRKWYAEGRRYIGPRWPDAKAVR